VRHVKKLLSWARGESSKARENLVRMLARRMLNCMTASEQSGLVGGLPSWATLDRVEVWVQGAPFVRPEEAGASSAPAAECPSSSAAAPAAPVPIVVAPCPKEGQARGADRFMSENRGLLRAEIASRSAAGQLSSLSARQAFKKVGWEMWKGLDAPEKLIYVCGARGAAASSGPRPRDDLGQFAPVPLLSDPMEHATLLEAADCSTPKKKPTALGERSSVKAVQELKKSLASAFSDAAEDRRCKRTFTTACRMLRVPAAKARRIGGPLYSRFLFYKKASKPVRGRPQKVGGRPRGSFKVSNVLLDAALDRNSNESKLWSRRHGKIVRILMGPKRALHRDDMELSQLLPYRTLARRTARCRRPFAVARHQTDKCDYCYAWDTVVSKHISEFIRKLTEKLMGLASNFWEDLSFVPRSDRVHDLVCWAEYIKKWPARHPASFSVLPAAARKEMQDFCTSTVRDLNAPEGIEYCVQCYNAHWQCRDIQASAYKKNKEEPEPGVLYIQLDAEDHGASAPHPCFLMLRFFDLCFLCMQEQTGITYPCTVDRHRCARSMLALSACGTIYRPRFAAASGVFSPLHIRARWMHTGRQIVSGHHHSTSISRPVSLCIASITYPCTVDACFFCLYRPPRK
jgi:hypothetical protein